MTTKKESILEAALELFSREGFTATSTSRIAREAGVSEGLIFRHFGSKQSLLTALLDEAVEQQAELLGPILLEDNPKKVIRRFIKLPFRETEPRNLKLKKLQHIMKWNPEYGKPKKTKAVSGKLTEAFADLKYKDPENEAQVLKLLMKGISTEILRGQLKQAIPFRDFLLKKYKVN